MLKMFLGAMSMSAFCLSLLGACSSTKFEIARTMWAGNDRGWLSGTALGAAILGVGMVVGGSCPGMVLSQVGSGVPNSGFTLFGGFVGALIYGVLEPKLARPMFAKGTFCVRVGGVHPGSETTPATASSRGVAPLPMEFMLMCVIPMAHE